MTRARDALRVEPTQPLGEWLADPADAPTRELARSPEMLAMTWESCPDGRLLQAVVLVLARRTESYWHWQMKIWDLWGWTYDRRAALEGRYHDHIASLADEAGIDPCAIDADTVRRAIDIDELLGAIRR